MVAPTRHGFRGELEQLRLQVELMGVRVDENLLQGYHGPVASAPGCATC